MIYITFEVQQYILLRLQSVILLTAPKNDQCNKNMASRRHMQEARFPSRLPYFYSMTAAARVSPHLLFDQDQSTIGMTCDFFAQCSVLG